MGALNCFRGWRLCLESRTMLWLCCKKYLLFSKEIDVSGGKIQQKKDVCQFVLKEA